MEEWKKELNEFHDAIDTPEDAGKKPETPSEISKGMKDYGKEVMTNKDIKPDELNVASKIFDDIMDLLRKQSNNKTFLTRLKTNLERMIKAEEK